MLKYVVPSVIFHDERDFFAILIYSDLEKVVKA